MKTKKVKIGIKGVKEALGDFAETAEAIERGESVSKEFGIYFEDIEAFRKALTPRRLELIHIIKQRRPKSIQELSRIAKRDIRNVSDDMKLLTDLGLVEIKKNESGRKETVPFVRYAIIELKIAV